MKKVKLVCVGSIKENYLRSALEEYYKRINKYFNLEVVEIADVFICSNPNQKEIDTCLTNEAKKIIPHLSGTVVALCVEGKEKSSEEFSKFVDDATNEDVVTFVIGSSYGLANEVKERAKIKLSFSRFTFPHQLMRVIFAEQLYRAGTIIAGATYHK